MISNPYNIPKPELLMPAGSPDKLSFAYAYGADAAYAGVPLFSLRARENEFNFLKLKEARELATKLNKKIYFTINVIPHNTRIPLFERDMDTIMKLKPDALIMADPGLISMVKERYPEIPIHLSVQANCVNYKSVKFWQKVGVSRVILSRELSITEIKQIKDHVPDIELEAFVHGSICIAYSGRCLLSKYFTNRDGNQGLCNNACRYTYHLHQGPADDPDNVSFQSIDPNYKPLQGSFFLERTDEPGQMYSIDEDENGTYIMNAKDLRAIQHLKEMFEAGVESFKAEGRTKSIYYLAMTTKAYRRAIDEMWSGKEFDPNLLLELDKIANRGYHDGFLKTKAENGENYDTSNGRYYSQFFGAMVEEYKQESGLIQIEPKAKIKIGDEVELVSPRGSIYYKVEDLRSISGSKVDVINPGTEKKYFINGPKPDPFSMLSVRVPIPDPN